MSLNIHLWGVENPEKIEERSEGTKAFQWSEDWCPEASSSSICQNLIMSLTDQPGGRCQA